ncbi:unnamed protein product [Adineta steineri]|uniref:Uncharacterized protein n=1 Tax=Adineta steineri TaxID=433720 RepID=A0A815J848_9BILA|nr:unnamed protein product [Adineta steineri]CAF1606866.1 unnamed protein product [Adineta steineri]
MNQQSSPNQNDQLPSPTNSFLQQRAPFQITERRNSINSSFRTFTPVAFFHHSVRNNEIRLQNNFMGMERRALAIATAPRRKRNDDDDDDKEDIQQQKNMLDLNKSPTSPIPIPTASHHHHSLPQTQADLNSLPIFRISPPSQNNFEEIDHSYIYNPHRRFYSSLSLPNKNEH